MVKRNMNKDSRRQQIINAARKLIFKYGSSHLTIRNIAKEVGISEAGIYRHFPSKMSIISLMADHIADNLLGDIIKAKDRGSTSLETLDMTMKNHFSAIEQRRGLSFQVIAEIITQGDRQLNKKVADIIDKYINSLQELLSQGVISGEIREDVDLHAAAQLLFGMILGLGNIWTLNNRTFDLDERYEELWKLFLCVITKQKRSNLLSA
ncbi:MAG: TetR/AcrR family transcriptional regulator [Nitrospirota bacterium]|nr:TetR/AcrR family transcriptional regulator [Nitrospirota bacterium]